MPLLEETRHLVLTSRLGKRFKEYPVITPYKSQYVQVSKRHQIWVGEYGNPDGIPVVFLHGGPGAGTSDRHSRFFNPETYRIILVDQRGAGKSTPYAELKENNTRHLVADFEKVRKHLGIKRWLLMGHSWGTTLALTYAETHPKAVSGMILSGIFMGRPEEIRWLYHGGAGQLFPEFWQPFVTPFGKKIPIRKIFKTYADALRSKEKAIRETACKAWTKWEGVLCTRKPDPAVYNDFGDPAFALLECWYAMKNYFLKPNQILRNAHKIQHIPTVIVQGRADWDCPFKNAWDLHQALPQSRLVEVPDAGHLSIDPAISQAWVMSTEWFKGKLQPAKGKKPM